MQSNLKPATSVVPGSGLSLYVHVPFCKTKCPYCDFNTYQGIEHLIGPYLDALTTELQLWGHVLQRPLVNTVFFGGGTPSYLPAGSIDRMLETIRRAFNLNPDAEITVEANPGDLDLEACRRLIAHGVNRLSIGVQSLDDGLLALLGRRHSAEQAICAFQTAQEAGFSNVNLDLMYGLPGQTLTQWETTLQRLLGSCPNHISLYCLTLEEGTPLHRWVQQGKYPEPDPDLAADMYQGARRLLGDAGYRHYEISNWALPGLDCRHNMVYWLNLPYLGVGPGAHSRLGSFRFWEVDSPVAYIAAVKQWKETGPGPFDRLDDQLLRTVFPVANQEYIDSDTACAETMFLQLRLLDGMDLQQASASVGTDLEEKYQAEIKELIELGLLQQHGSNLRLASSAYLIANQVFTRFVA